MVLTSVRERARRQPRVRVYRTAACGGVPLKTRGVIFERASVFSVFRGRCRSARLRVRRVCAKMNVERVGVKNAAFVAQLEDFEAMARTQYASRYYILC